MKKFTFTTNAGFSVTVIAKDADRARCAAKKAMGDNWSTSAHVTRITNAL